MTGGAELDDGQGSGVCVLIVITEHIIGKPIARGLVLDDEGSTNLIVSDLVEAITPDVGAEFDRVGAVSPGHIVGPLKGVVVVDVGAVTAIAEAAEARDAYAWNAPS